MVTKEMVELTASHQAIENPQLDEDEHRRAFPYEIYLLQASGLPLDYIFTCTIELGSGWVPHSWGLDKEIVKFEAQHELAEKFIKDN